MSNLNKAVLWLVKVLLYMECILLGFYNAAVVNIWIAEKAAEKPEAALIMVVCVMLLTWLVTISIVNCWKIR